MASGNSEEELILMPRMFGYNNVKVAHKIGDLMKIKNPAVQFTLIKIQI